MSFLSFAKTIVIITSVLIHFTECKIEYTNKEVDAIQKLRIRVSEILYQDYMNTDDFLITWIRDKSFDLDKAEQKLRKAIEWRKSNDIDSVLDDPKLNMIAKWFPFGIEGHDRDGRPIVGFHIGNFKVRKAALAGKLPLARRCMNGMMEKGITEARRLSRETGRDITQYIIIANMAGYNLKEHGCLACVPFYLNYMIDFESNYPQTTRWILVVNTPKIFDNIVQLLRPIMSPGTRDTFIVFGYNQAEWKKFITNDANIDPKDLSVEYGGTRRKQ